VTPTPTATASGTSYTFNPNADSYVNASQPTSNFGSLSFFRTDSTPEQNAYVRINVTGTSGSIQSATLRLFSLNTSSAGFDVHEASTNGWNESTINYNNAPGFGGVEASSGVVTAFQWIEVDVTSMISGNGELTFVLTGVDSTNVRYLSKEASSFRPELVVVTN
jgi:hypothetical protein